MTVGASVLIGWVMSMPAPAAERPTAVMQIARQPSEPVVVGDSLGEAEREIDDYYAKLDPSGVDFVTEPEVPQQVSEGDVLVVEEPDLPEIMVYDQLVVTLVVGSEVPDLRASTAAEADELLRARGLVMVPASAESEADWRIDGQSPGPGSLLPFGEAVEVRFAGVADSTEVSPESPGPTSGRGPGTAAVGGDESGGGDLWPWVVGGLAVIALAVIALAVVSAFRALRGRRATTRGIRIDPHPDLEPTVALHRLGDALDVSLRIEPHPDPGRQTMEEVTR